MRQLILIVALFFVASSSYSQVTPAVENHTNDPRYSYGNVHEYMVRFIGFDGNVVLPVFQQYLREYTLLRSVDNLTKVENGWFKIAYISSSANPANKVVWIMTKLDKDSKILEMKITGDAYQVIKLFCSYWSTNLDFDAAKAKELVIEKYGDERIALSTNFGKGNATVIITKNK